MGIMHDHTPGEWNPQGMVRDPAEVMFRFGVTVRVAVMTITVRVGGRLRTRPIRSYDHALYPSMAT